MNSTHFSLTLLNIRNDNAGEYICAAQDVLSTYEQDISLCIKGTLIYVYVHVRMLLAFSRL